MGNLVRPALFALFEWDIVPAEVMQGGLWCGDMSGQRVLG